MSSFKFTLEVNILGKIMSTFKHKGNKRHFRGNKLILLYDMRYEVDSQICLIVDLDTFIASITTTTKFWKEFLEIACWITIIYILYGSKEAFSYHCKWVIVPGIGAHIYFSTFNIHGVAQRRPKTPSGWILRTSLIFRVVGWCNTDVGVSYRLEPENTSGWQVDTRASWSLHGVGASFQLELIKPGCWGILRVVLGKSRVLMHPFSWSFLLM